MNYKLTFIDDKYICSDITNDYIDGYDEFGLGTVIIDKNTIYLNLENELYRKYMGGVYNMRSDKIIKDHILNEKRRLKLKQLLK